jgi:hypothetical protein
MKVRIDYSDGHHTATPYTEGHEQAGLAFVEMTNFEWMGYCEAMTIYREWQNKLLMLSNIQYEKECPND